VLILNLDQDPRARLRGRPRKAGRINAQIFRRELLLTSFDQRLAQAAE
jgi:hypothetical protein